MPYVRFINPIEKKTMAGVDVERIEEAFGLTFVGDFTIKNSNDEWINQPVAIFYQPNPDKDKGHSNYLGAFLRKHINPANGQLTRANVMLVDGTSAAEHEWPCIEVDDDLYIYSSCRNDFMDHGGLFIDGGPDYVRYGWTESDEDEEPKVRYFRIVKGKPYFVLN